ncbi:MAG: hypothetical protein AV945_gp14 [Phormidium phage MIS-PhV1B]|uniref:hypothetical protein n=1 Tax=Phormidium phage MIS-PhV1B TaxID=1391456 RepID=UPI0003C93052|nr:MAG: hypothetical protein AV945_gp14 [Phormidium phage MIS-PhV1B]AGZ61821.1 MAG: hypothetical protein [Phormidium phage MIS-PhV1B]
MDETILAYKYQNSPNVITQTVSGFSGVSERSHTDKFCMACPELSNYTVNRWD